MNPGRRLLVTVVALSLVAPLGMISKARGQSTPATPEVVLRAWRARQDRVKTARFEWTQTETYAAHSLEPGFPAQDVKHQVSAALSLSGGMLRYESRGPRYAPDHKAFLPQRFINVFNGSVNTMYFSFEGAEHARLGAYGFVNQRESRNVDAGNVSVQAIAAWCRVFDRDVSATLFETDHCVVSPKEGSVQGRACVILERSGKNGRSYWVDAGRDWIILRYLLGASDKPTRQVDISYTLDKVHGWVPARWKYVALRRDPPEVELQIEGSVSRYEINVEIPKTEFEFDFPVGTVVRDLNTDACYIICGEGRKRAVTREER
ncbi:MAG: hypothetical protein NUV77_13850 [Thermoguttaceae bacterium]|jgi:hypothetical protein|nr:hypothetical protein [Thermoguttaceae bacterium]